MHTTTCNDVTISRIVTDRHVTISSCMVKDHPHIKHQYDDCHLSKWVVKKLTNKSKEKGCEELSPWIQSISNHLWWSAATCDGNVDLLREKWKSVFHHITNKHKWSGNTHFHQCYHRHIPSSEAKKICWLKPGSQAHLALEEVVLNMKLLKDLAKLTDFCHTGRLEVYHSMTLKYALNASIFLTWEWLLGPSLLLLTITLTRVAVKLRCNQENRQARHATACAFQKQTSDGLSSQ